MKRSEMKNLRNKTFHLIRSRYMFELSLLLCPCTIIFFHISIWKSSLLYCYIAQSINNASLSEARTFGSFGSCQKNIRKWQRHLYFLLFYFICAQKIYVVIRLDPSFHSDDKIKQNLRHSVSQHDLQTKNLINKTPLNPPNIYFWAIFSSLCRHWW